MAKKARGPDLERTPHEAAPTAERRSPFAGGEATTDAEHARRGPNARLPSGAPKRDFAKRQESGRYCLASKDTAPNNLSTFGEKPRERTQYEDVCSKTTSIRPKLDIYEAT